MLLAILEFGASVGLTSLAGGANFNWWKMVRSHVNNDPYFFLGDSLLFLCRDRKIRKSPCHCDSFYLDNPSIHHEYLLSPLDIKGISIRWSSKPFVQLLNQGSTHLSQASPPPLEFIFGPNNFFFFFSSVFCWEHN